MKTADMNERQKKAYFNIYHAADYFIGGLENELEDNERGSAEYEEAKRTLEDHEYLVNVIYREATTSVYRSSGCYFGALAERIIKDIRFCGKEFLLECVEARVKKMGY